jgi:LDH2 family malate/lactate/ureidoglycolate dehydrogenase
MQVSADVLRRQLGAIFCAWATREESIGATVEAMVETDLRGVDSHGIAMLPLYDELRRQGKLRLDASPRIVRETAATALIDAGAGLGHPAAVFAMNLAVDKCHRAGVAVAAVFNSHHFGAAGVYAKIAAERGAIGMVTSSTRYIAVVPTFGAEPVIGTNPIAFAAPAGRNPPFILDMATSTVAAGRVKVHKFNDWPVPSGWVVDGEGRAVTDAGAAVRAIFERAGGGLAPLGGSREQGSHKGYGLAVMAHILGGTLSGASFSPIRDRTQRPEDPDNIGHFFLAIDPGAFRAPESFTADLDQVIDVLHGTRRADPGEPVLVAGDPELAIREERLKAGVPIPPALVEQVRAIAGRAGAAFLLEETPPPASSLKGRGL